MKSLARPLLVARIAVIFYTAVCLLKLFLIATDNPLAQGTHGITPVSFWVPIAMIPSVMASIFFLHRAYSNAFAAHPEALTIKPLLAAAVWFIPVVNLFLPGYVVYELWKANGPSAESERGWRMPALFLVWWVCWLIGTTPFIGAIRLPYLIELAVQTAAIVVAALAFVGILKQIAQRQESL